MLNLLMVVLNDQTCHVAFPRKDDWELCFICEIALLDPTTNQKDSIMVKEWVEAVPRARCLHGSLLLLRG